LTVQLRDYQSRLNKDYYDKLDRLTLLIADADTQTDLALQLALASAWDNRKAAEYAEAAAICTLFSQAVGAGIFGALSARYWKWSADENYDSLMATVQATSDKNDAAVIRTQLAGMQKTDTRYFRYYELHYTKWKYAGERTETIKLL
jgi:uncharacterized membrane protein